jgi:hypothetical protein
VTRSRLVLGAVIVGLAVLTVWLYVESMNATGTAQIVGYQRTGDPAKIVIIVAVGRLDDIGERKIEESASSVRVTVRKRSNPGTAPASLAFAPITVGLREGLGERAVLNETGTPVPDRGTYELPQPSPSR